MLKTTSPVKRPTWGVLVKVEPSTGQPRSPLGWQLGHNVSVPLPLKFDPALRSLPSRHRVPSLPSRLCAFA